MSIRARASCRATARFRSRGQEFPDAELISSFVGLYYDMGASVARRAVAARRHRGRGAEGGVADRTAAGGGRRRTVEVLRAPARRPRKLVELARKNAAASFATRRNARADTELALGKLQRRLKLPQLPRTIECYDVSHLQGFATVASMVVFVDGRPDKSRYRTYKVRAPAAAGAARTNDDFASMYEVLSRRFRRARSRPTTRWKLPDLIVVDGGKGQLAMALAAARDVGISVGAGAELSIVALAKEREDDAAPAGVTNHRAEAAAAGRGGAEPRRLPTPAPVDETPAGKSGAQGGRAKRPDRVFLPHAKDAIPIRPSSGEMFVLQALRDEAHRFAVSFHRGQRRRLTLRSALASIPGIGPGRQRQLLRHFGSIKRVREASVEDLASVPGMTRPAAEAVFAHWAKQPVAETVSRDVL